VGSRYHILGTEYQKKAQKIGSDAVEAGRVDNPRHSREARS
jgi:hypothetical protein